MKVFFAAVHESAVGTLRRRTVTLGVPLAAPKRTWSGNTRRTGFDYYYYTSRPRSRVALTKAFV